MTTLALLVCSILHDGGRCREVELQFADLSVLTCTMAAMPIAAQWATEHPNWSVRRWQCRPAGIYAKA
jgi:hypothetical protein